MQVAGVGGKMYYIKYNENGMEVNVMLPNGSIEKFSCYGENYGKKICDIYSMSQKEKESFTPADAGDLKTINAFLQWDRAKGIKNSLEKERDFINKLLDSIPEDETKLDTTLPYEGVLAGIEKKKIGESWVLYSTHSIFTGQCPSEKPKVLWIGSLEPIIKVNRRGDSSSYTLGSITIEPDLQKSRYLY